MSIRMMAAAWSIPLSPGHKLILLALADHADDDGFCWPGLKGVATKAGLSERTVRAATHDLERLGMLTVQEQHRPDGTQTANLYRLTLQSLPPTLQPDSRGRVQPDSRGTVQPLQGGRCNHCRGTVQPLHPMNLQMNLQS